VELATGALLRGPSEKLLDQSVAPAMLQLEKDALALKAKYDSQVPLPPPTSLRTTETPTVEVPLSVLMEVLSPEFPVFLAGTPFTTAVAKAAVAIDRSPEALEEVALAVDIFRENGDSAIRNASEVSESRRLQVEKRHILELEELYAVDGAAAVLEAAQIAVVPNTTKAEREGEWKRRAGIRSNMRLDTMNSLILMQQAELDFFGNASIAVLDHMRAKIAAQSQSLADCLTQVNFVINSKKPSRQDACDALMNANKFLAEAFDMNEDEASFYTTIAALSGSVAVTVEQTMRMLMRSILEFEQPDKGSKLHLTQISIIALRNAQELFARATQELEFLLEESRVMKIARAQLKPRTTTNGSGEKQTKEPYIHVNDRSPGWLRRKAFIQRVRKLKEWKKVKMELKPGKDEDKGVPAATTAKVTGAPSSGVARGQILALSKRLKAFAQGIAEYDQARVAFKAGKTDEGQQALANALDDIAYFTHKIKHDGLSNVNDPQMDAKEVSGVKQILAARVRNVQGHLQVSAFLRNEGTDGVNFFAKNKQILEDIKNHVDSVSANMENVVKNFKSSDDIIEGAETIGVLMGGTIGAGLRTVRKRVVKLLEDGPKDTDLAMRAANKVIEEGQAYLTRIREDFSKRSEDKYGWAKAKDDEIDKIN
jgi:hypothetical protein